MARTKSRRVLRSAFGNERFASTARDHLPTRASRTECFVGEHCSVDLSGDGPDRCPLVFVTPPTNMLLEATSTRGSRTITTDVARAWAISDRYRGGSTAGENDITRCPVLVRSVQRESPYRAGVSGNRRERQGSRSQVRLQLVK